jgi:DNA-binding MarR family transcriptional regulator
VLEDVGMTTVEPVVLAEELLSAVARMRRLVDDRLKVYGLSLPRAKILGALVRFGPSRQNVLATTFSLAPRTVTELVDSLERDGLVERKNDPTDRRANAIHLTPAGREAQRLAEATKAEVLEQVFGKVTDEEKETLLGVCARIAVQTESPPPC